MANKSQGTWTSHLISPGEGVRSQGRPKHFRTSERPKQFARAKLVDTPNVTAGTLNPHLPKRTIAADARLDRTSGRAELTAGIGVSGRGSHPSKGGVT
jgi:hypothetical protein